MKYIGATIEYGIFLFAVLLALPIMAVVLLVRIMWWALDTATRQPPDRRMRL